MRSSIVFLTALATAAMGDNSTSTYSYTFPAGWNLGLVESGERSKYPIYSHMSIANSPIGAWCSAQRNTCPDICQKGTKLNSCDAVSDFGLRVGVHRTLTTSSGHPEVQLCLY